MLIRNPKKDFYPEKHRDEGPLLVSDKEICPERAQRVEGSLLLSDEACLSRASTGSEGSLFIPDKKDFYPEEHRYEGPYLAMGEDSCSASQPEFYTGGTASLPFPLLRQPPERAWTGILALFNVTEVVDARRGASPLRGASWRSDFCLQFWCLGA